VLNPYRAVTGVVATGTPEPPSPLPRIRHDAAAEAAAAAKAAHRHAVTLLVTATVGGLFLIGVLVAVVVPRGRARGWQPGSG
jgi:hypothetical protein